MFCTLQGVSRPRSQQPAHTIRGYRFSSTLIRAVRADLPLYTPKEYRPSGSRQSRTACLKDIPVTQSTFRILVNRHDDCLDVVVTPAFTAG
jgi:hypothetical protein